MEEKEEEAIEFEAEEGANSYYSTHENESGECS